MGVAAILVMLPGPLRYTFVPHSQEGSTSNLALIRQAVCERNIFENGGHIHVYSPGAGADNTLWSNVFINTFIQSVESFAANCCKLPPSNDFVTVFSHSNV